MSSGTHRPPPTVLLKQDEYEPFGEKACLEKLHKVGRTTDSIRKTAAWVFHYRNHLAQFVKIWIAEFRRASPSRRLNLYYVAHETLALCKKKKFDKGFSCFQSVLREATVYSRDRECKTGVRKVFNIFAEASFFPEEFLLSLREDLERGKSTANYNKTVLADFDPAVITSINDHMREFRQSTLTNLEKQYAEKEKALDVGNQVISKIKEHAAGKEYLEEFDGALTVMRETVEARDQDLKYEYDLLNQLELLRIYYSTTAKQSDKVIVAYRNYEYAAQTGMRHLEKAQSLLSIPLPGKAPTAPPPGTSRFQPLSVPTEIEMVEMDMDMSDEEENAAQEATRSTRQPSNIQISQQRGFQREPLPLPLVTSTNTSIPPQVSFESILSAFSGPFPQLSPAPKFGLPAGPHHNPHSTMPLASSPQMQQQLQYSGLGPAGPLSPHQRHPLNFRPTFDYQSPFPRAPLINHAPFRSSDHIDHRFFSSALMRSAGGFDQNGPRFEHNGTPRPPFGPILDRPPFDGRFSNAKRPILTESRRSGESGSLGGPPLAESPNVGHPIGARFSGSSALNGPSFQGPPSSAVKISGRRSPEGSVLVNNHHIEPSSPKSTRAQLNVDEDGFDGEKSAPIQQSERPPLLQFGGRGNFAPGGQNQPSKGPVHQQVADEFQFQQERPSLLSFSNQGNVFPGARPDFQRDGGSPMRFPRQHRPPDFTSPQPTFRPGQKSQFSHGLPDFRMQAQSPLQHPRGGPFPNMMQQNGGQFHQSVQGLLGSPGPFRNQRPPFSEERPEKAGFFEPIDPWGMDFNGSSLTPVSHNHTQGPAGGAELSDEDISLTERLRRLSQSQSASSNIVLTSPSGPTRKNFPQDP